MDSEPVRFDPSSQLNQSSQFNESAFPNQCNEPHQFNHSMGQVSSPSPAIQETLRQGCNLLRTLAPKAFRAFVFHNLGQPPWNTPIRRAIHQSAVEYNHTLPMNPPRTTYAETEAPSPQQTTMLPETLLERTHHPRPDPQAP